MKIPKKIELIEVGLWRRLQNESEYVSTEAKQKRISQLLKSGISRIETSAFIRPERVLEIADEEKVIQYCHEIGMKYMALTPNIKALEKAIEVQVPQIAHFVGASDTFNLINSHKTTEDLLLESQKMVKLAKKHGIYTRVYIPMSFICPYQGDVSFEELQYICERLVQMGVDEIDIGDSYGKVNPNTVYERFYRLKEFYPNTVFVGHFYGERKLIVANMLAAMKTGIDKFDSSIGGNGASSFLPKRIQNMSTEYLALILAELGIYTGIDLQTILKIEQLSSSHSGMVT